MPEVVQSGNPLVQVSTSLEQRQDRHGINRVLHHRQQTRWATFNVNGFLMAHKHRCLEIDLLRIEK